MRHRTFQKRTLRSQSQAVPRSAANSREPREHVIGTSAAPARSRRPSCAQVRRLRRRARAKAPLVVSTRRHEEPRGVPVGDGAATGTRGGASRGCGAGAGEGGTLVAGDVAATPREAPARTLARVAPPRAARAAAPRTVSAAPATLAGKGRVAQLRLAGPADRPCSLPGPVVSRVLCPGRTFLEGVCAPPKHSEYGVRQCLRPPGFRWRFWTSSPPPPPHQG